MAGSGYKTFNAGDILTAAEVQGYLQDQAVMVFATTTARDAAITSPSEGMYAFITGDNATTVYTGSEWIPYVTSWRSYTPTWSAGLTVGNGTTSTGYALIGKTCILTVAFTFGSTSSISGDVYFTLPVDAVNTVRAGSAGRLSVIDASPLTRYTGMSYIVTTGGTQYAYCRCINASGTYATEVPFSSSVPIAAWTTSDYFTTTIVYQTA